MGAAFVVVGALVPGRKTPTRERTDAAGAQTGLVCDIELHWIDDSGASRRGLDGLRVMRERTDSFCWVDSASWSTEVRNGADLVVDQAKQVGLLDQYERVARISQSQLEVLMGVTEFHRARTDTTMTIAAERLALIAAVTLPVTAVSSVMGMNVIVNASTHWVALTILLARLLPGSGVVLRRTKRLGWW